MRSGPFMPMLCAMIREGRWSRWVPAFAARLLVASLALTVVAWLQPRPAHAGTLQVRDTAAILTVANRTQLEAAAARAPFDVRVLTSSAYADQAGFSRYVGGQVNEANEVVVGVDPVHHHTQVHFGTGSRIAPSEWTAIERAGNGAFRDARWAPGIVAILDQATTAVGTGPTTAAPASSGSGLAIGGIVVLLLVIAVPVLLILAVVAFIRRATRGSLGGPGYAGPGYGGPGYGGPGPGYGGGYGQGGWGRSEVGSSARAWAASRATSSARWKGSARPAAAKVAAEASSTRARPRTTAAALRSTRAGAARAGTAAGAAATRGAGAAATGGRRRLRLVTRIAGRGGRRTC